jgi:hypothetical protein
LTRLPGVAGVVEEESWASRKREVDDEDGEEDGDGKGKMGLNSCSKLAKKLRTVDEWHHHYSAKEERQGAGNCSRSYCPALR